MLSLNCHAVGIIEEFDNTAQTVKVKMAYKKKYYEKKEGTSDFKEVAVEYPLMVDCPAIVMSGGDFSLKMPIKKGDECLVMFNDRSIDEWFEAGQIGTIKSSRLHSFSDGIVLVGVRSLNRSIDGYEENKVRLGDETHDLILGDGEATLKKGTSKVQVKDKINISNASESLLVSLVALCDAIISGQTTVVGGSSSGVHSFSPATISAANTAKTKIQGLLE